MEPQLNYEKAIQLIAAQCDGKFTMDTLPSKDSFEQDGVKYIEICYRVHTKNWNIPASFLYLFSEELKIPLDRIKLMCKHEGFYWEDIIPEILKEETGALETSIDPEGDAEEEDEDDD